MMRADDAAPLERRARLERLAKDLEIRAGNARRAAAAAGLALVLDEAAGLDGAPHTRGIPQGVVLARTVEGGGRAYVYFEGVDFQDVDAYFVIDVARLGDDDGFMPYVELSEDAARRLEAVVDVLHEPLIVQHGAALARRWHDGLWTVAIDADPLAHALTIDGGFLDPRTHAEIEREIALDEGELAEILDRANGHGR
ncbi:MAG TPA: hypothetical protein VFM87_08690 [Agrococcus sp.]|nr:hypothetical protein [Agrococcus sp.]